MTQLVRIVIVRSLQQLLSVIPVLRFQDASTEYPAKKCEDILLICSTNRIILRVAKIWNFKQVLGGSKIVSIYRDNSQDIDKIMNLIRKHINKDCVDVIYAGNNHEDVPRLIMSAYPNARKISYGHSLGHLQLRYEDKRLPKIDDAYLCLPLEINNGAFNHCQVVCVEPKHFESTIDDAAKIIKGLKEYCQEISTQLGTNITVCANTYLSDPNVAIIKDIETEIDIHIRLLLEYSHPGESILIKGHMHRGNTDYSPHLAEKLRKNDRKAIEVNKKFKHIALELFVPYFNVEKHISLVSTSAISFALLCQCDVVMGFSDEVLEKHINKKIIKDNLKQPDYYAFRQRAHYLQILQAYRKEFTPITHSEVNQQFNQFPKFPVHLSYKDVIVTKEE